jgi:hypothetical protein
MAKTEAVPRVGFALCHRHGKRCVRTSVEFPGEAEPRVGHLPYPAYEELARQPVDGISELADLALLAIRKQEIPIGTETA